MNIFEEQAKAIQKVREASNVVPLPTHKLVKQLHAEGKVLVHKPTPKAFQSDDDLPPEAA